MTNRIPQIKPRELVRILEKFGFVLRRKTGSHAIMRHPFNKDMTVIPLHAKDVKRGLLFGILKQANISQKDFLRVLKGL